MKRIIMLVAGIALIAASIGIALWNKPRENMASAKAAATIEAATLFKAYNADEQAANTKYLGKTIAVSGIVKECVKTEGAPVKVSLETGDEFVISCELDPYSQHARTDFPVGAAVTFKGKCDGLNLDVQLSRCVEVSQ